MSSKNGFISLQFSLFLTIFFSLYFTLVMTHALFEIKDSARKICIQESFETESYILQTTRLLFDLNPASTLLRTQIATQKVALAAAIASGNEPAALAIQNSLNLLYKSQNVLDQKQKSLIAAVKNYMRFSQVQILTKLYNQSEITSQHWNFILQSLVHFTEKNRTTYPVQPDPIGGVAPNYEWELDAEQQLTMAYNWNLFFTSNSHFQKLLTWTNNFSMTCGAKAQLRSSKWHIKIIVDRF